MKFFSMAALVLIGGIAHAQSNEWYAARFGFNGLAPDLFANQSSTDYRNLVYNEGNPTARFSNSSGVMTGTGVTNAGPGRAWNDPSNHGWTDFFEITDMLPKNTWVRLAGNLTNHFPNPYNQNGQANTARNLQALIGRVMFRGSDLSNGLNLLWNITPGVYPSVTPVDPWSSITTDPWGTRLSRAYSMGDPARRDWWRPEETFLPYLRNSVQSFVYDANNFASTVARQRSGSGAMQDNFIARMGFQLGNEPAAGHPGGSVDGPVGSWTGVGNVLEKTMANIDYKPNRQYMRSNNVPGTFGANPLTMPAFSMFSEGVDSYRLNYVKGQLRNVQWAGNVSGGVNEIATYFKEMQGMNWASQCSRRALHLNSPAFRWKLYPVATYSSTGTNDLLVSAPFDPSQGRWETPAEYAKRWVAEMTRQVDLVANLAMPGSSKVVDITECYFTAAQSAACTIRPSTVFQNGSKPNFAAMSFDQIRTMARSYINSNETLIPLQQSLPSRESILAAIRAELYAQDVAGTLTKNLGRIYWWGAYYPDPRTEAGLISDGSNNVVGFDPWSDYRLTLSEVKALLNKQ